MRHAVSLLALMVGCGRGYDEGSADTEASETGSDIDSSVDPGSIDSSIDSDIDSSIDSNIDPDDLIPAIDDLPGNPSGPAPPRGRWLALGAPLLPKDVPAGRPESMGTTVIGHGFLFRSVGGKPGEPFVDPADVLRLGSSSEGGLFFDPPSVSGAGGFILASQRGLFRASPSATSWTRVPCPSGATAADACGSALQTATGAILLLRRAGMKAELFRTTDDGATWTSIAMPSYSGCGLVGAVGSRLLMQCEGAFVPPDGGSDAGAYRIPLLLSKDDGKTFTELPTPAGIEGATYGLTDAGVIAVGGSSIRLSKDDGASWTTSWTSTTDYVFTDRPFPARGRRVFVGGRVKPAGTFFLLRSRDGGESFTRLTTPPPIGSYTFRIAVGDAARVEAWEQRSEDDGETWKPAPLIPAPTLAIVAQGKGPTATTGDLWALSQGVHRSNDGGATWNTVSVPDRITAFAVDDATGSVVIGTFGALHRSTDGGVTWVKTRSVAGEPSLLSGGGVLIARAGYTSFDVSTDGGVTWRTQPLPAVGVSAIAVSPTGAIYAGGHGWLAVSDDRGDTWAKRKISTSISGTIAVAPSGEVFLFTRDVIFRTKDRGKTWGKQASAGLPSDRREVLAYVPRAPLGMFFARSFAPHADGIGKATIYASIDGGASFHLYDEGMHAPWIFGAAFDSAGRLFAGTSAGIYQFQNAE